LIGGYSRLVPPHKLDIRMASAAKAGQLLPRRNPDKPRTGRHRDFLVIRGPVATMTPRTRKPRLHVDVILDVIFGKIIFFDVAYDALVPTTGRFVLPQNRGRIEKRQPKGNGAKQKNLFYAADKHHRSLRRGNPKLSFRQ
jgi:hypothetical protein